MVYECWEGGELYPNVLKNVRRDKPEDAESPNPSPPPPTPGSESPKKPVWTRVAFGAFPCGARRVDCSMVAEPEIQLGPHHGRRSSTTFKTKSSCAALHRSLRSPNRLRPPVQYARLCSYELLRSEGHHVGEYWYRRQIRVLSARSDDWREGDACEGGPC